ncbi:MAG: hypothetical protein H6558_08930 [Lewinellaceae bacterium]|nr:hypothetical protein [Lewinellaceae bacterium]MCB9289994.1 hypothetical protein [Lewinellaceae bacterium]
MISEAQLLEWKKEWRRLVADSIAKALEAMEEMVPAFSPKSKLLVNLRARLNEANRGRIAGTLSNEQLQLEYNRIRMSLLETIDALTTDDFRQPMAQPPGNRKKGYLLHKIPPQMQVEKEEECIIRLAYEQAAIVQDIELSEEVEVKQITVSKIMQAELIDPNAEPAFAIRTYSDEEQFLQEEEYTEWKFWVKPLREGTFNLLLKISVVEVVEGKERTRNLTWEEKVQIITETPQLEPAFKESGVNLAYQPAEAEPFSPPGAEEEPRVSPRITGSGKKEVASRLEEMIQPTYRPGPGAPVPRAEPSAPRRSRINIRRLSIAATVLVVVGVALSQLHFFTTEQTTPGDVRNPGPVAIEKEWEDTRARNDEKSLEDFIEKYPDSEQAEEALWELARKTGEQRYYKQYLEQYPKGKYVEEAQKFLGRN